MQTNRMAGNLFSILWQEKCVRWKKNIVKDVVTISRSFKDASL